MNRQLQELLASQILTPLVGWRLRARALARRIRTRKSSARRARLATVVTAALVLLIGAASAAMAESGSGGAFLDAFEVTDSRGNPVYKYTLSVDTGGWSSPTKSVSSFFLYIGWGLYRLAIVINLWLFDWALQFRILEILLGPANLIATVLNDTIGRLGLVPIMLILAFIAVAHWVGNGQAAKGVGQLILSLVMAALLASVLANPVQRVAGPEGLIVQARDTGVSLAASIVTGGQSASDDPKALQAVTTAQLVDQFVRVPHQLINYGYVIDDACVAVYDEQIEAGPLPMEDEAPRKAMAGCDSRYEAAAENPVDGLYAMIALGPSGMFLGLLFLVFTFGLTFLTAVATYEAGKFVLALMRGILPGAGRDQVFSTLATFLVAFVAIIFAIFGIGIVIVVIQELFERTSGEHAFKIFMVMSLLVLGALIALVIFFIRAHKAPRKLGERMSRALSSGPAAVPTGPGPSMVQMGLSAKQYLATKDIGRNINRKPPTGESDGGSTPEQESGQGSRRSVPRMAAKGAWMATKAGVAYTVGAPVAVPRAAATVKAAAAAKKAQMATRLAKAGQQAKAKAANLDVAATEYGREYAHNVGTAVRFAGRATGATKAAQLAMAAGADPLTAGAVAGAMMVATSRSQEPKQSAAAHAPVSTAPTTEPPPPKLPRPDTTSPSALPTVTATVSKPTREKEQQAARPNPDQVVQHLRDRMREERKRGGPPAARPAPRGPARKMGPR